MADDILSDDEDREVKLYALLHYVDAEVANKSLLSKKCVQEDNSKIQESIETHKETTDNVDVDSNENVNVDTIENEYVDVETIENENVINTNNHFETVERNKKRVSHSDRFWNLSDKKQNVNRDSSFHNVERDSSFYRINNTKKYVSKSRQCKNIDNSNKSPIITLVNLRDSHKRKSSDDSESPVVPQPNIAVEKMDERNKSISKKNKKTEMHGISLPSAGESEVVSEKIDSVVMCVDRGTCTSTPNIRKKDKNLTPESSNKIATPKSSSIDKNIKKVQTVSKGVQIDMDNLTPKDLNTKKNTRTRTPLGQMLRAKYILEQKLRRHTPLKQFKNIFNKTLNNQDSILIDSSDDESVIEVEIPTIPTPTIDLESSDESPEITDKTNQNIISGDNIPTVVSTSGTQTDSNSNRKSSVSPVPSIISSVSDDFIQGDCSSLNISIDNTHMSNLTFDFRLHGSDLCDVSVENTPTSTKKSKQKRSDSSNLNISSVNESVNTPQCSSKDIIEIDQSDLEYFATPKSKIKKRRNSKGKNYAVPETSYVTPSTDIYESESSDIPESVVDVPIVPVPKKKRKSFSENFSKDKLIELTTNIAEEANLPSASLDNVVIANVIGLESSKNDKIQNEMNTVNESQNAPDKNDRKERSRRKKKPVDEMDEYYNTIYDKDFDHVKLRSKMPKDREFWKLDAADKGRPRKSQASCNYCFRTGHRTETCYRKPKICSICGKEGHTNTRCPKKICLNCGSSNKVLSSECQHCKGWRNTYCGTCRGYGHPALRCPDTWRRYHLTIKNEVPLIEDRRHRPSSQLFCSGCTKRGHLIHECDDYIKFSDFKPVSPFIFNYTPLYTPDAVRNPKVVSSDTSIQEENENNTGVAKSISMSPGKRKENNKQKHSPKINKLNLPSISSEPCLQSKKSKEQIVPELSSASKQDGADCVQNKNLITTLDKNQITKHNITTHQIITKDTDSTNNKIDPVISTNSTIPQSSMNVEGSYNKDNGAISNLLLTSEHSNKLAAPLGQCFINNLSSKYNISIQKNVTSIGTSIVLKGNPDKHINFQFELQEWMNDKKDPANLPRNQIPKERIKCIQKINSDFKILKKNLGNPSEIFGLIQSLEKNVVKFASNANKKNLYLSTCKQINKNRRLLNMILIGQAGLCGGDDLCRKLSNLVNILSGQVCKDVSGKLRDEIGECHELIFSGLPRNDYPELIEKFNSQIPSAGGCNIFAKMVKYTPQGRGKQLLKRIFSIKIKLQSALSKGFIERCDIYYNKTLKSIKMGENRLKQGPLPRKSFTNLQKLLNEVEDFIHKKVNFKL